jgi:hypothetical protein
MKFKKIVGFGDSWVWGDELIDPALESHPKCTPYLTENTLYREQNCFLGLLSQHYSVPVENYGIPGGSLQSAVWTFLWWLDHEEHPEDCLILVGHTDSSRFSYYDPNKVVAPIDPDWDRFVHSAWPGNSDWQSLIQQQTVLTDCRQTQALRFQETVLLFDGVAARQGLDLVQFNLAKPMRLVSHAKTMAWPDWSFSDWFLNELPATYSPATYRKPGNHPNELGHQLIRDRLISHIDSCIIRG